MVGGTIGEGFARFGDSDDVSAFPDNRNVSLRDGEVKNFGEVGQTTITQVLQMKR
jgi:hypothetical protein